jgi:hypothetical protein
MWREITQYRAFTSGLATAVVVSAINGPLLWRAAIASGIFLGANFDVLFKDNMLMGTTFSIGRALLVSRALEIVLPPQLGFVADFVGWTLKFTSWFYMCQAIAYSSLFAASAAWYKCSVELLNHFSGIILQEKWMLVVDMNSFNLVLIDITKEGMSPHHINVLFPPKLPAIDGIPPEECGICGEDIANDTIWRQLACKHFYHAECIDKWFANHDTCPKCRHCHTKQRNEILRGEILTNHTNQQPQNVLTRIHDVGGTSDLPVSTVQHE